jgi:hypothetical protein
VSYKDRKSLAADLRKIYTAVDAEHAGDELEAFAEKWDARYPMISASWLEHWEQITPFLAYPLEVRRVIYTTDENVKCSHPSFSSSVRVLPASGVGGGLCEVVGRRQGCRRNRGQDGPPGRCRLNLGMRDRRRVAAFSRFGVSLALGLDVGVVDPGAKRRFWD